MAKICGQVNIPNVDETELECEDVINSGCIQVTQICNKVGNIPGQNLNEFIVNLCNKLSTMDAEIAELKQDIINLQT